MRLENHEYKLKGSIGMYKVDVTNKHVEILQGDSDTSAVEGTVTAEDLMKLIHELQTVYRLMV